MVCRGKTTWILEDIMILVTGASGTVGSKTVEALQKRSAKFKGAYRDPGKAPAGVEAVAFDYDKPATWEGALKGIDTLFLLTPPSQPKETEQGLAMVEAAKKAGLKKIVKLSAAGVEFNPSTPHRQVELAIEASGLAWAHSRPTFFQDNFVEGFLGAIKSGTLALPAGDGKTAFIDSRDIGEANAVLLTESAHDGKGHVLKGPQSLSHAEVVATINAAAGTHVVYKAIEDSEFRTMMKSWGATEYAIEVYSTLYKLVTQGATAGLGGDLKALTGRDGIPLAQFAKEHASLWK
jgi:uncharacterized protein YbjT (DUF2867 family)